ncbi:hypothetical protein GCM10022286_31630 [Gryllotalpicola daejeonensis]|uniref:Uncharacterized protein n=1 Tax=Gryllotalpicola daejeonensis TaxID=993087 RepID=A0ABP7ZP01_9MICO
MLIPAVAVHRRAAQAVAAAVMLALSLSGCSHVAVPKTGSVTVEVSNAASPTGRVTITAGHGYTKVLTLSGTESRRVDGVPLGHVTVALDGACTLERTLSKDDPSMNVSVRGKHCSV